MAQNSKILALPEKFQLLLAWPVLGIHPLGAWIMITADLKSWNENFYFCVAYRSWTEIQTSWCKVLSKTCLTWVLLPSQYIVLQSFFNFITFSRKCDLRCVIINLDFFLKKCSPKAVSQQKYFSLKSNYFHCWISVYYQIFILIRNQLQSKVNVFLIVSSLRGFPQESTVSNLF